MSDEVAFIKGILSQPEDRLRWLVYADWLAERNDPREEWCRATAAWMEETESGKGENVERLNGQRELARQRLDPNWLAVLDSTDAFTIMLPADLVTYFQQHTTSASHFTELHSWGTVQSDFRTAKVTPGSYVYAIQLLKGDVLIVGRLRVNSQNDRTQPFVTGEYLTQHRRYASLRPEWIQIVTGTEGQFLHESVPLPRSVLERLRYARKYGARGLSSLKGGKLTNATTIQGVFRLTRQSRLDLAWLLFRSGEIPPVLAPTG